MSPQDADPLTVWPEEPRGGAIGWLLVAIVVVCLAVLVVVALRG